MWNLGFYAYFLFTSVSIFFFVCFSYDFFYYENHLQTWESGYLNRAYLLIILAICSFLLRPLPTLHVLLLRGIFYDPGLLIGSLRDILVSSRYSSVGPHPRRRWSCTHPLLAVVVLAHYAASFMARAQLSHSGQVGLPPVIRPDMWVIGRFYSRYLTSSPALLP